MNQEEHDDDAFSQYFPEGPSTQYSSFFDDGWRRNKLPGSGSQSEKWHQIAGSVNTSLFVRGTEGARRIHIYQRCVHKNIWWNMYIHMYTYCIYVKTYGVPIFECIHTHGRTYRNVGCPLALVSMPMECSYGIREPRSFRESFFAVAHTVGWTTTSACLLVPWDK